MTFARFMELALYDPDGGYYSTGPGPGRGGDFVTAVDAGRAFGRCLARQFREIDRHTGPYERFDVVEFGGGRGLLARDVLDSTATLDPDLAGRLRYVVADRSPAMQAAARVNAPDCRVVSPEALQPGYRGCLVAVELFDALPAHRLRRQAGRLVEVRVGLDAGGAPIELAADPTPAAAAMAERYGAAPVDGMEAEVCPALFDQFDAMDRVFEKGIWIVVDYGYPAAELYGPAHARGTLLAYHRHTTNEDYLARIGEQDLTTHVNFTAIEDRARERGLRVLGRTTQDRFLIANGILETFEDQDPDNLHDPARARARLQAMQLIHPSGMGRTFKVLLLAKSCDPPPDLAALHDPFARDGGRGRDRSGC